MAIIYFKEIDDKSGSFDDEFVRDYSRHYLCECDSILDQEPEIYQHSFCPQPRKTRLAADQLAVCIAVEAKMRRKTRYRWDVTAKFSSKQVTQQRAEDPLDDPAKITLTSELIQKEKFTDENGNPFMNAAGEPVKVIVEIPQNIISVSKNIALYNGWISDINGIINSAPVRIRGKVYPARTLKVTQVQVGDIEYRNDVAFMVAQLQMREEPDGWVVPYLHQGYYELVEHPKEKKNGKPLMKRVRCRTGTYADDGTGCDGEPEAEKCFLLEDGTRPREEFTDSYGNKRFRPKFILDPEEIIVVNYKAYRLYDFRRLPLAE